MSKRTRWQELVIAQARFLEYECTRLCQEGNENGFAGQRPGVSCSPRQVEQAAQVHLERARRAAGYPNPWPRGTRLVNVWNGSLVTAAFANLHCAKVVLVDLYSEEDIQAAAPNVLARLRACLPPDDHRRQKAEALFGPAATAAPADAHCQAWFNGRNVILQANPGLPSSRGRFGSPADELAARRSALREAMHVSYDAADEQYARVRSFRNILLIGAAVLSMLVIAVCLVGAFHPRVIPLCFHPSSTTTAVGPKGTQTVCPTVDVGGKTLPAAGDVTVVALMGVLGGALSATFAIQKLRGTSTPFAVPVALAFFKLPAGALTAIAGLLLIQGDFVPGLSQLDSQGQILAYALVFGVAQHLVTRFVGQRANDVLSSLPSKERAPAGSEPPNQATQPGGGEKPAPVLTA